MWPSSLYSGNGRSFKFFHLNIPFLPDLHYNRYMLHKPLMSVLSLIVVVLGLAACTVTRNVAIEMPPASSFSLYEGKIVGQPFINKVGQEKPNMIDLYFETGGKRYFIKFGDSAVSRSELVQHLNKNLKVQGKINYGLWDTNNPNDQSRVGEYIVIGKMGGR